MFIIIDTWCIDLLFKKEYSDFQYEIEEHERNLNIISTTIFNKAERISWIKEIELQKGISSSDRKRGIHDIKRFFKERIILFPTHETEEFYFKIIYWLKKYSDKKWKNKLSKWEIKMMHNDIWIASIALENNWVIYTSNKNDFEKIQKVVPELKFKYVRKI